MGARCEVADLHDKEDPIGMGVSIVIMERSSVSGGETRSDVGHYVDVVAVVPPCMTARLMELEGAHHPLERFDACPALIVEDQLPQLGVRGEAEVIAVLLRQRVSALMDEEHAPGFSQLGAAGWGIRQR
jgi:hypothetical protein